jgi:xylan 1,4-beta-xylosidase
VVYRLGESIEHTKRKYYVNPPKDLEKWTAACLGIIRHYNEGWANGFRHGIRYWEIWNEPENRPAMWTGNDEEYFRLYETAAKAIKARWPELKVGGPSVGYTGRIKDGRFEPGDFLLRFLERCRDRKLPLDFFSWHLYTNDPSECMVRAQGLRSLLDRSGFAQTELHFNEWNYLPGNDWSPMMGPQALGAARERFYNEIGGAPGAAFTACVLLNLQDTPVDVANYYVSDNHGFGLFTFHGTPRKNFYAMKAFRRLLDTPLRVEVSGGRPDALAACAGLNRAKTEAGLLIGNYRLASPPRLVVRNLPWNGPTQFELFVVDATRNLEAARRGTLPPEGLDLAAELKAPAVVLVTLKPEAGK